MLPGDFLPKGVFSQSPAAQQEAPCGSSNPRHCWRSAWAGFGCKEARSCLSSGSSSEAGVWGTECVPALSGGTPAQPGGLEGVPGPGEVRQVLKH